MKIMVIFFLVLLFSLSFIIGLDISLGFSLSQSLSHLLDPFRVMDIGEYIMIIGLVIIVISNQILITLINMKNKKKKTS